MAADKVLVVDDEESLVTIIQYALEEAGYEVATAPDAMVAEELLDGLEPPDLIILDIMLPEKSGLEFCREVRAKSDIPVIILSAKSEELDRVLGLELGADDYVTKPFSPRELVSRVRANLRRASVPPQPKKAVLTIKDLTIDTDACQVFFKGEPLRMTASEYQILRLLAQTPGKVFSRAAILSQLWEGGFVGDQRTVDVHVHNLRDKIEPNPKEPQYILTVRTLGYRLCSP